VRALIFLFKMTWPVTVPLVNIRLKVIMMQQQRVLSASLTDTVTTSRGI
jgi:hypothetical protein